MSPDKKTRILCVDDEPRILEGLRLRLRRRFDVATANSGKEGLEFLETNDSVPIVISDMRMPEMNGAQFLAEVRQRWPDTVRILLTGYSEVDAAISAVNDGEIFRFLTKPCPPEVLTSALEAAQRQYELVRAEHELLEDTLRGSVQLLTEILSTLNPGAFSRAARLRRLIRAIDYKPDGLLPWELELGAMLCHIGLVGVPAEVFERQEQNKPLSTVERQMLKRFPATGATLVSKIPRLERVAKIIELHQDAYDSKPADDPATLGARTLQVVIEYDRLTEQGTSPVDALEMLATRNDKYDRAVVEALEPALLALRVEMVEQRITFKQAVVGMILNEPAKSAHGMLVAPKGSEITEAVYARLQNFARFENLQEPLHVLAQQEMSLDEVPPEEIPLPVGT